MTETTDLVEVQVEPLTLTDLAKLPELTYQSVGEKFIEILQSQTPGFNGAALTVAIMNKYNHVDFASLLRFGFYHGLLSLGKEDMEFFSSQEDIIEGLLPELLRRMATEGK